MMFPYFKIQIHMISTLQFCHQAKVSDLLHISADKVSGMYRNTLETPFLFVVQDTLQQTTSKTVLSAAYASLIPANISTKVNIIIIRITSKPNPSGTRVRWYEFINSKCGFAYSNVSVIYFFQ